MSSNWKWDKSKYHPNYKDRARQCKEQAGWKCEQCGVAHKATRLNRFGQEYTVYMYASHVNHDPWNPDAELVCLCCACHSRYDQAIHSLHASHTLHYVRKVEAGQLELFNEKKENIRIPKRSIQQQYRRCSSRGSACTKSSSIWQRCTRRSTSLSHV